MPENRPLAAFHVTRQTHLLCRRCGLETRRRTVEVSARMKLGWTMSRTDLDVLKANVRRRVQASKFKSKMIQTCFEYAEAAAQIGVSERALRRMIRSRAIRAHRLNGVGVVSRSEIARVRR